MVDLDGQNRLLERIGERVRALEALAIGGSAMLHYTFSKTATKDIDLVLLSDRDRKHIIEVLKGLGFRTSLAPKKAGEPHILELDDYRLGLFSKRVFSFRISKTVLGRIKEKIRYGNLVLSVMSPEDIILSKSMTDRVGDREDVMEISKEANIEWDAILSECEWQAKNGDFRFCVYLHDFLDELVHDFGLKIPREVERKIKRIYRDFLEDMDEKRETGSLKYD